MKTDVYSWRVESAIRRALEDAARRRDTSVADLLDMIARAWLAQQATARRQEAAEQKRLHAAARHAIGAIAGGDPQRSQRARDQVRRHIADRHGR